MSKRNRNKATGRLELIDEDGKYQWYDCEVVKGPQGDFHLKPPKGYSFEPLPGYEHVQSTVTQVQADEDGRYYIDLPPLRVKRVQ